MRFTELRIELVILAGGLLMLLSNAQAQTNSPPNQGRGHGKGQVVSPERPTDATIGNDNAVGPEKGNGLPQKVEDRIQQFKTEANAYLEEQQAIKKQMQGASDEERAALRAQLEAAREKWLERSRELRQLYKERRAELEEKLKDHRELFDELRNSALERRQKGGDHRRRGGD